MENVMNGYHDKAPSDENLKYCLVTKEAVLGEKAPSTERSKQDRKVHKKIRRMEMGADG